MRKLLIGFLSVIILILIWQIYALYIDNNFILPYPSQVFLTFVELIKTTSTYKIIGITLLRLFIAFILSTIIAITLGLLAGNFKILSEFFQPLVTTLRTLPVASIIIIILILAGNSNSLYIITFLMIFPIIYEATKQGVLNISKSLKNAIALETHNRFFIMTRLQLPLALPYIKTSLFQSIGLGFKVIVMAEFIAQTPKGIGRALFDGSLSINYELVFAWTLIIIFIVSVFEYSINKLKEI
ncbi:MAG: ABC transporter permease subunit [Candidatus Izimaplasma sp.]|nr:ABC transporter permease subunit [Candidatus Izimaplasma bacterium]